MLPMMKSKRREDLVGIVERSVGQDVRLDPFENVKAAIGPRVEPVDLSVLFVDLGDAETTRIMCRLRMVGDADIAVAMAAAGFSHRPQRVDTVRGVRMGMQHAVQIVGSDQLWNSSGTREHNLIQPFAHLRFDVLETERFVDRSFCPGGDDLSAAIETTGRQCHSGIRGPLAKRLQMPPRTGREKHADP
jgi:hypothetical protein